MYPLNGVINLGAGVPKAGIKVVHIVKTRHNSSITVETSRWQKVLNLRTTCFTTTLLPFLFFRQQMFVFVY